MDLGAFSISLAVSDLAASRDFYARLGFAQIGGNIEQGWLIVRNNDHVIGLFQGMFDRNMLTFNPGWDQQGGEIEPFTDIRVLREQLQQAGVDVRVEGDMPAEGPASVMVIDPDGNPILFDQHR